MSAGVVDDPKMHAPSLCKRTKDQMRSRAIFAMMSTVAISLSVRKAEPVASFTFLMR